MDPEDLPPGWHLEAAVLVFAALFYFLGDRSVGMAAAGGCVGISVFLMKNVKAQGAVLRSIRDRLDRLEGGHTNGENDEGEDDVA